MKSIKASDTLNVACDIDDWVPDAYVEALLKSIESAPPNLKDSLEDVAESMINYNHAADEVTKTATDSIKTITDAVILSDNNIITYIYDNQPIFKDAKTLNEECELVKQLKIIADKYNEKVGAVIEALKSKLLPNVSIIQELIELKSRYYGKHLSDREAKNASQKLEHLTRTVEAAAKFIDGHKKAEQQAFVDKINVLANDTENQFAKFSAETKAMISVK